MPCRLFRPAASICMFILFFLLAAPAVKACTLWAAAGNVVQGGGTIIIKNRDWTPGESQRLEIFRPAGGYSYAALMATREIVKSTGRQEEIDRPVAGINEKGLTVISAAASSLPRRDRQAAGGNTKLMAQILNLCATVDDAMALDRSRFRGPLFLMLADKNKIAVVEIGLEGMVAWRTQTNGVLYHTNHYLEPALQRFNRSIGESSTARYARIAALLQNSPTPYTFSDLLAFTRDQDAGPDDSIWRTGSTPTSTRTVAVFAVSQPKSGEAEIYVRLLEEGKPEHEETYSPDSLLQPAGKRQ
ncbi:carcinine hydrolase/isopenicillin-N N-acyltransferase family protein [Desulfovibrio intestinalis]|uniref:Peptidase C45 hydrolase domain-containing protein n=1 Tax=Desulfovibrio intestinalis TaxID=58621 RepID=A0A7W8C0Q9_9BACT|nr:carcinine hydrolase/isopenicillin-N N-acyltransferase family protein [Desulfovibrio intestinalis]MBB5143456.1 hypothetical protein [Desulfovibrio intestinalis]